MNYHEWIVRDPKICGGPPTIRGTRVTLRVVLGALAGGDSVEQIVKSYPSLTPEAIRTVIAFAADSALDDMPLPPIPTRPELEIGLS
jgi:uncharacterized protein (DUF433 family)